MWRASTDVRQCLEHDASHENSLAVWNVADGTLQATLRGHAAIISAVAVSPDNRRIASGAANGHIRIWNAETFAFERELMGHHNGVLTLEFHPDGETLASGSMDGTVRIWSSTRTEPMSVLPGIHAMTAATFSADGRQLAVAPRGGGVELWSPQTVERQCTLVGGKGSVVQIAYSPDGMQVVTAASDGNPRIWGLSDSEIFTARQAERAAGHEAPDSPPEFAGSISDRGEGRRPHLLRGLLEATEERREVGDVLPVQAEGLEVR